MPAARAAMMHCCFGIEQPLRLRQHADGKGEILGADRQRDQAWMRPRDLGRCGESRKRSRPARRIWSCRGQCRARLRVRRRSRRSSGRARRSRSWSASVLHAGDTRLRVVHRHPPGAVDAHDDVGAVARDLLRRLVQHVARALLVGGGRRYPRDRGSSRRRRASAALSTKRDTRNRHEQHRAPYRRAAWFIARSSPDRSAALA